MMAASALAAAVVFTRVRGGEQEMPQQKNPTELKSALFFAGLYAAVLMALSAAHTVVGEQALYCVAILSGMTDMDAITLSSARLVQFGPAGGGIESTTGWRLIVVATMANHFFKWAICLIIGCPAMAWRVGFLFAVPMSTGVLLLWLWS